MFHTPVTLSLIYMYMVMYIFAAVITGSVKPCIVIVIDVLPEHALFPGDLDLSCSSDFDIIYTVKCFFHGSSVDQIFLRWPV